MMTPVNWQLAHEMARELAERKTDPNEVQKAVAYIRSHRDGARLFALLDTMVRDGRYLVRSGQTLDYYRDLRDVCNASLSEYRRATGDRAEELGVLLGWVVRLMRYYGTAGSMTEVKDRRQTGSWTAGETQEKGEAPRKPAPGPQPAPPREEVKRERVTLLADAREGKARVRTRTGEEIPCTKLPAWPPAKAGRECWADVTRRGGRALSALFKGWT